MNKRFFAIVAVINVSLLVICFLLKPQSRLLSCDIVWNSRILPLPDDTLNAEQKRDWVRQGFKLPELEVMEYGSGDKDIWWNYQGVNYSTQTTSKNLTLRRSWEKSNQPKLQDIIRCMGKPAQYDAYTYQDITKGFVFEVWYPDKKTVVYTVMFKGTDVVSWDTLLTNLFATLPSSITEDLTMDFMIIGVEEVDFSSYSKFKKWPDNLSKIEIEEMRKVR